MDVQDNQQPVRITSGSGKVVRFNGSNFGGGCAAAKASQFGPLTS